MATNTKEYQKKYQEENKDKIKKQRDKYREKNKDIIDEKKKEYYSIPKNKQRKAETNAKLYQLTKGKVLARQHKRRKERLDFTSRVVLHYGCQNTSCQWVGDFESHQLSFHHFDASTKIAEVATMMSLSIEKIVDEINKCVVLCRNCHADVHHGDTIVNESMLCKVDSLNFPQGMKTGTDE